MTELLEIGSVTLFDQSQIELAEPTCKGWSGQKDELPRPFPIHGLLLSIPPSPQYFNLEKRRRELI